MAKKAAILSDSLLSNRPRKGEAKAQSETQASLSEPQNEEMSTKTPRRRRRRSDRNQQLNFRVSDAYLNRFMEIADKEDKTFAVMFERLVDCYMKNNS